MGLQKEIWIDSIIKGLYSDDSFLVRSVDHSEWVNDKVCHVPNKGARSKVVKDRSTFPAEVSEQQDIDLTYMMHEFTTDPVRVSHADSVELSYNKRESVISEDRAGLHEEVADYILGEWCPTKKAGQIEVSEKITRKIISATEKEFNKNKIPQKGRVILLGADAYQDLLDDMTEAQSNAFLASADAARGVIGKLYSFEFLFPREFPDENVIGLAWHPNSVSRAQGEVEMFEAEKSPTFYSDVFSFLCRAGGSIIRNDGKGVKSFVKVAAES